jgi:hypothetical protein
LWRSTLIVLLAPDRLEYRLMSPLGKTNDVDIRDAAPGVAHDRPLWRDACDTLGKLLDEHGEPPPRIEVLLSDCYVHYQVLEWRPGIVNLEEWRAYARHMFALVHGEAAKQWDFRIDIVPPGRPSLACGIDQTLIAALRTTAHERGARLAGIRPQFVRLFNRKHFSARNGRHIWFAVVDRQHACLGVQIDGRWRAIRNEPAPDGWQAALPGMVRRVSLSLGEENRGQSLYLCGNLGAVAAPAVIDGLSVQAAETSFLRGRLTAREA